MGLGLAYLDYLVDRQLLGPNAYILDIGSQNLYNASPDAIVALVDRLGARRSVRDTREAADRLSYFSTPRPGERTAFVSELLDLTTVSYLGYDVCPSPGTQIFDLNIERLPASLRGCFDLVLNFGTTEHLVNQLNAFEVMHDAMRVGGVCLHQIPSLGWIDHGYVNYHGLMLDDLVRVNDYCALDKFYTLAGESNFAGSGFDVRNPNTPSVPHSAAAQLPARIDNINLNYLVRKTVAAPFHVGLEIATTHAVLSDEARQIYGPRERIAAGELLRNRAHTDADAPSPLARWWPFKGRLKKPSNQSSSQS